MNINSMKLVLYLLLVIPYHVYATSVIPNVLELDPSDTQKSGVSFLEQKNGCNIDSSWIVISLPAEFQGAKLNAVFLSLSNGEKMLIGTNLSIFENPEISGVHQVSVCLHPSVFKESEVVISFKNGMHITNEINIKNLEGFLN